jgi:SAM-dependent methyltransferase
VSRIEDCIAIAATSGNPSVAMFEREWRIYRKMLVNNYLFHREAYDRLHHVLSHGMVMPFRFLDIGCGDATASVAALSGTGVTRYYGLDLSAAALGLAAVALEGLACRVDLRQADFAEALRDWREPVDVAWIGLALHHLHTPAKLGVMRELRRIVGEGGRLLIYENASPDGEDRPDWLRRWDLQKPHWLAYTPQEWDAVRTHVASFDFPETDAGWHALGREAGFSRIETLFIAPTDLFRMYCFRG